MKKKSYFYLAAATSLVVAALFFYGGITPSKEIGGAGKVIDKIDSDNDGLEVVHGVKTLEAQTLRKPPSLVKDKVKEDFNSIDSVYFGEKEVSVSFEEVSTAPHELVLGIDKLVDVYHELEAAADEGDPLAARTLAKELHYCSGVYGTQEELTETTRNLQNQGVFEGTDDTPIDDITQRYEMSEYLTEQQRYCSGISSEMHDKAFHWAEKAADSGDYLAMNLMFYQSDSDEHQYKWLSKAWEDKGHVGSAAGLSSLYSTGIPNVENSKGELGAPNPILSYAYFLIAEEISLTRDQSMQPDSPSLVRLESMIDNAKQIMTTGMTYEEITLAEETAALMVEANENCCLFIGDR